MSKDLIVGIDIGNAKTELAFESGNELRLVRQPSVISYLPSRPEINDQPIEDVMKNLMDNLTINISSPAIKRNGDYYVGNRAMLHDGMKTNMLINLGGKATHDLPVITSLAMVAATALKNNYDREKKLPSDLTVNLKMATAIPSSEYSELDVKTLEDRFINEHKITLFIAAKQVLVNVNVERCKVTEEGRTAMLAFFNSDDDILRVFNDTYKIKMTPKDFVEARTLHSDIGDGTSEFVVIKGANPVPGLSYGKRLGVGFASDYAIKLLGQEINISDKFTRQQLQEWLIKDNEKGRLARQVMSSSTYIQAQSILEEIQLAYQELASSDVDYLFVHGGGSITFQNDLQEELMKFAKHNHFKVIWIPEEYATTMNSRGTYHLAKITFGKVE